MKFFNPKEDILDVQLTQHGKRQLADGKFKPVFYAFYDNDVIYDSDHAEDEELQNQTEPRIKDETPRIKAQYVFSGIENSVKSGIKQTSADRSHGLGTPLGTSEYGNSSYPAWNLDFYKAEIVDSSRVLSGSTGRLSGTTIPNLKIPQIEIEVNYESNVLADNDQAVGDTDVNISLLGDNDFSEQPIFLDGTSIQYKKDYILLDISELNGVYSGQNFDIEVFEIEKIYDDNTGWREELNRLEFNQVVEEDTDYVDLERDQVQYFFNIFVDEEIDNSIFCTNIPKEKRQSFFFNTVFDCDDNTKNTLRKDIYEAEDSGEIC